MFSLSPRQCCYSLIKIKSNNIRQFIFQGLFTYREEDPRRQEQLFVVLHAEISVHVVPK